MSRLKVLPKRFLLNGHTLRFHPRSQKLELRYLIYLCRAFLIDFRSRERRLIQSMSTLNYFKNKHQLVHKL